MPLSETIFNRLAHENEDSTTELLVNLMKNKFFRDICLTWLLNGNAQINKSDLDKLKDEVRPENICTQIRLNYIGSRPDIKIETSNFYILIENKVKDRTQLQPSQKKEYPQEVIDQYLKYGKKATLIFLIPENYIHKTIITDTIAKEEKFKHYVEVKDWTSFLNYLYKLEIDKVSNIFKDSLEFFSSVVDKTNVIETSLTKSELALMYCPTKIMSSLQLINTLIATIDKINDELVDKLFNRLNDNKINKKDKNDKTKTINISFDISSGQKWHSHGIECGKSINCTANGEEIYYGFYPELFKYDNNDKASDFVFSVGLYYTIIPKEGEKALEAICENKLTNNKTSLNQRVFYKDNFYYFKLEEKMLKQNNFEKDLKDAVLEIIDTYIVKYL